MNFEPLKMVLYGAASQLPIIVVCIVCLAVLGARWRQVGDGAVWAALGLGLTILLVVIVPIIQSMAIHLAAQNHNSVQEMLRGTSFLFSCLHAVACGLLFTGVLAGRASNSGPPPPLPPDAYR